MGHDLVTLERTRCKYVFRDAAYYPYSAGELARLYLERLARAQLGADRIRDAHRLRPQERAALAIPPALFFDPARGRAGPWAMVDIAACYWALATPWPLNIGFEAGRLSWPRPAALVPPAEARAIVPLKPLRHAAWGTLRGSSLLYYREGTPAIVPALGPSVAPGLVGLVMHSIHTIAAVAVADFGAAMWLTDAGIFRPAQAAAFRGWLRQTWALGSRVKAGPAPGYLYAAGDYRIGQLRTRGPHLEQPALSTLVPATPELAAARRERLA